MNYWLFKSEPDVFSIDDLKSRPAGTEPWDGVRNYQARNFMRDEMKKGDLGLFYHSNCAEVGVVGVIEIVKESHPDPTAFDPESHYYDPKSSPDNPRWMMVAVQWKETFADTVTLQAIKDQPELNAMRLVQKGNRLSVMPVSATEFSHICAMAGSFGYSQT